MRDAFALFDEIKVAAEPLAHLVISGKTASRGGFRSHIDYWVSGILEFHEDGTVSPTFRLIDASDGIIVWTRTFERARLDRREYQESLVRRTVVTIAQVNGVIQGRDRAKRFFGAETDSRYACLLDHNEYRQSYNPAEHELVRGCLTQAIADDPNFSLGFALLGRLQVRHHAYQFGHADGDQRPLDRALRLARRAVEIDSESSTAYLSLMIVHFSRRELDAAWAAAARAVALNPHDMLIRADYGFALLRSGQMDKGGEMLREAVAYGHLITPRVSFAMFLLSYLAGDMDAAKRHLDLITSDTYPPGLMAQALVAAKTGHPEEAQQAIRRLEALQPSWLVNPKQELSKVLVAGSIVDRLADDLRAIGVGVAH